MRYIVFVLVLFGCFIENKATDLYKDVEIESGPVRGYLSEDGDYFTFLGIPYATAPLGKRRFRTPFPAPYWKNVFRANRTVKCPQYGEGNEDCLIVNVFTPTKILNGPLPVLVYIHGGAFIIGAGQTKGVGKLINQNVIVVTINYRLGALGFLCLGIEEAPGNAGLKDQIEALKWVQGNIDMFGGDPNQVTIYGMSAGGASVELLILSDLAKHLFQKAIIESGTATAVWSVDADPINTALCLAETLNLPKKTRNIFSVADFYRYFDVRKLSAVNFSMYQKLTNGTFGFAPCIERKVFRVAPFIKTSPLEIIKSGEYNKVPMMFIFASSEGLFLRSSDYDQLNYKERMNANFDAFMPGDLKFDSEEVKDTITENVKKFYFGDELIGDNTKTEYLNYFGDHYILHGLLNSAITYSKNNTVYLLEFAYKGNLGSHCNQFDHLNVAGHGDAIKHVILNKKPINKDDELIVHRMVKIVTNFMKYSNPIPTRTPLLSYYWPPVKPDNVTYLQMNKELQVFEEPRWERKKLWDTIYGTFRKPIDPVNPDYL